MSDRVPDHTDRGFQLLQSGRADLAIAEFRAALGEDPTDALSLAGLAISLSHADRDAEALESARAAVAHEPDLSLAHAALAQSLLGVQRPREALPAARRAVELDPTSDFAHGLEALSSLQVGRAKEALAAAERGLALDADSGLCLNTRALALARLNRTDDAEAGLRSALARDPESPLTHTSLGHALLLQGRVDEAAVHFREALRRDPSLEPAREGLLHTLRARFLVYRLFLAWLSFCARMPRGVIAAVLLGSFIVPRLLAAVASSAGWVALAILPIRLAILAFIVLTWIGMPLFNGFLLLTRDGRLLLRPWEKTWAIVTLCVVAAFFVLLAVSIARLGQPQQLPLAAMATLFMLAPIGTVSGAEPAQRSKSLLLLAGMAAIAAYAIVTAQIMAMVIAIIVFLVAVNLRGLATMRRE